jgi:hypothetical protein
MQHNAMLQQQVAEMRAAQQREREQAAVLAGNGSAMAQQLAEAQREAEGLRQVCCVCQTLQYHKVPVSGYSGRLLSVLSDL